MLASFGSASFLGEVPPSRLSGYAGPADTLVAMARACHGARGERSVLVRKFTEEIVRDVWPKDYLGEIIAVRNTLLCLSPQTGRPFLRYTNDPRHVELIKDPERLVSEINQHGSTLADCDESACLVATMLMQLGREVEFVALGFGSGTQYTHVGVRCREPKSGRWLWIDTVAGPRESEAAQRATRKLFYKLD